MAQHPRAVSGDNTRPFPGDRKSVSAQSQRWVVLKFGGTSVSRRNRWDTIGRIAAKRMIGDEARVLVVVSALSGVTNELQAIVNGDGIDGRIAGLVERHRAFCAELDRRWREQLASRRLYVNDIFLTLVLRPTQGSAGVIERILKGPRARDADITRDLRELSGVGRRVPWLAAVGALAVLSIPTRPARRPPQAEGLWRSALDGQGNPYPLLHLEWQGEPA